MLETSKDVLYLVIAFCVLWFTIFLCWTIYYFGMILKRINDVTEALMSTVISVREFFDKTKEKVNNLGNTIAAVTSMGEKAMDYFNNRKAQTAKKSRKKE